MMAVYKPDCGVMPAEIANAMDSGRDVIPTTIPAIMSRRTWLRDIPARNVARHAEKKSGGAMGIMERSLLLFMNNNRA